MFWDNFVFYCNQKGVAPNVAAADVGVKSSGTVTGWKNGAIPRQGVLKRLADYFGVPVSDLTGEQKETPISREQADGLTEEEKMYVEWFRNASDAEREIVKRIMNGGGS